MDIYIVCWFDRHSDPYIKAFARPNEANSQIEECMGWRTYDYVDSAEVESADSEFSWVWKYPAYRYVQADIDDGPHGYILQTALINNE